MTNILSDLLDGGDLDLLMELVGERAQAINSGEISGTDLQVGDLDDLTTRLETLKARLGY